MVHINVLCLNVGTCSVICVWRCLNLGILSILKQNNANLPAYIDKSLDNVLPRFSLNFQHFAKDFGQNIKNCAKESGTIQKIMCLLAIFDPT